MEGIRQYKAEYEAYDCIYAVIEIDFSHKYIWEIMIEALKFFHSEEYEIEQYTINCFVQHIASAAYYANANDSLNIYGVRRAIEEMEGYPNVSGEQGVKLLRFESIEIDDNEFEVEETKGWK